MSAAESPRLSVPFNDHARVAFAAAAPGSCTARIPAAHELTNHLGTVHGGALFTVAEAASGRAFLETVVALATTGSFDPATFRAVVSNAQIRFCKPARGEISAHARVATPTAEWSEGLRLHGKTRVQVDVEVQDPSGLVVAEMSVEWHLSQRVDSAA